MGIAEAFWVESIFRKKKARKAAGESTEMCAKEKKGKKTEAWKGKSFEEKNERKLLDFNVIKLKPNVELSFHVTAAPKHFCVFRESRILLWLKHLIPDEPLRSKK